MINYSNYFQIDWTPVLTGFSWPEVLSLLSGLSLPYPIHSFQEILYSILLRRMIWYVII